jgi:hypothetical protein
MRALLLALLLCLAPPTDGFYVMPWAAIGVTLYRNGEPAVGTHRYDPLPLNLFGRVNIGWDFRL